MNHAAKSGVVAAMLVARAQDIGPFTPGQVIVSVVRGNRVYLVEAPASALIEPMAPCVGIWSEVAAKRDIHIEAGQRATDTTARDSNFRIADKLEWQGDTLVRQCYAEHVTADPDLPRWRSRSSPSLGGCRPSDARGLEFGRQSGPRVGEGGADGAVALPFRAWRH